MPAHSETQIFPYTTRQLFDMVADIERYPEFLPWCRAARVTERSENEMTGELIISFAHMTERYASRIILAPPASDNAPASIDVEMISGPFEYLINRWKFAPDGEGARVDFFLDFKFRSFILEKMIGSFFGKATQTMVEAFKRRADALYGTKT